MPATRFPARASGPAERLAGFMAHLRMNGLSIGPGETAAAMAALSAVDATDPAQARLALRALLATDAEVWERFDALFDAWWMNAGRVRRRPDRPVARRDAPSRPAVWDRAAGTDAAAGRAEAPDPGGEGEAEGTEGRLIATRRDALARRDLRELMDEGTLREAEAAARRIARAIRDRRSRRRRAARRGAGLDMRRVIRRSLARGGEPAELVRTRRPDRPVRLVALLDVSGSMTAYARVFLAFVSGLLGADARAEAWLFHTRLVHATPALTEPDPMAAATRLSLMAEGFGGGTDIAGSLAAFADGPGGRALTRRSVVVILSDGCCTAAPERIGAALARIRRRAGRIVWLNPLAGWRDYAPVAAGIAAALPHLDAHLPANTLGALAALEDEFARL